MSKEQIKEKIEERIRQLEAEKMNTSKITKAGNFPLIFVQMESTNA